MKLESFQSSASDVVSANVQNISALVFFVHFCQFYEKEIFTQFYGRFDHFLRTYSAANFWMIKLCLNVNNAIHANEYK